MQFPAIPCCSLLLVAVGGPSPILAEGPGSRFPPFLARARHWRWCVLPCQSRIRSPSAAARHSWL